MTTLAALQAENCKLRAQLLAAHALVEAGVDPRYFDTAVLLAAEKLADPLFPPSKADARAAVEALRPAMPAIFFGAPEAPQARPQAAAQPAAPAANPWRKGPSFNITRQGEITRDNPDLARKLAAEAQGG